MDKENELNDLLNELNSLTDKSILLTNETELLLKEEKNLKLTLSFNSNYTSLDLTKQSTYEESNINQEKDEYNDKSRTLNTKTVYYQNLKNINIQLKSLIKEINLLKEKETDMNKELKENQKNTLLLNHILNLHNNQNISNLEEVISLNKELKICILNIKDQISIVCQENDSDTVKQKELSIMKNNLIREEIHNKIMLLQCKYNLKSFEDKYHFYYNVSTSVIEDIIFKVKSNLNKIKLEISFYLEFINISQSFLNSMLSILLSKRLIIKEIQNKEEHLSQISLLENKLLEKYKDYFNLISN